MSSKWDDCALSKKLLEIHNYVGDTFDTESVLVLIQGILNLVTSGVDGTQNGPTNEFKSSDGVTAATGLDSISDLLHNISCVFNCKCSGGDSTMEIMKLLSSYDWEAKIAIVLAAFVVDYAQFIHATKLYKNNRIGELIAVLKQIPDNIDDIFYRQMKSKFDTIIDVLIKVTSLIAQFSSLQCKYISKDVAPMADALNKIPIAVYSMITVVVAGASQLREILGHMSEINSPTEAWFLHSLEEITRKSSYFKKQLHLCRNHKEEEKLTKYVEKLKLKFNQTVYVDNQKILQLIINTKDRNLLPLESGLDKTTKVGVEALKGKTVLLFISDIDTTHDDEIFMLTQFYQDSRENPKQQLEIVWLPVVENDQNIEKDEKLKQKFEDLKSEMQWYWLQHPGLLKPGLVRYMKEEWLYSKENPILVALDPRGKMVNQNAFNMVLKWGNAAYPFTKRYELDIWNTKKWSLQLLVDGIDQNISKWIKEDKIICLYGGQDEGWIQEFVTRSREVEKDAAINKIEMMYIGEEMSQQVIEILARGHSLFLKPKQTRYLLKRIESMMHSVSDDTHNGSNKEAIVAEMGKMHRLGHSRSWALMSQGGHSDIAMGVGEEMLRGLQEFESWSARVRNKGGFVMALNGHLAGRHLIPQTDFCTVCRRPMHGCYTQ